MFEPRWDIRDVVRAPRFALDGQAVRAGTLGALLAGVVISVFTWLAVIIERAVPFYPAWYRVRMFPWVLDVRLGALGMFVLIFGIGIALFVIVLTHTAVAKIAYRRLKGDLSYDSTEAWRFAERHGRAVIVPLVMLMGVVLAVIAGGLLVSVIARIPVAGEIFLAAMVIPGIAASAVAIFAIAGVAAIVTLGPSIAGTLGDDWLDLAIAGGALAWSQWWRWLLYEIVVVALGAAAIFAILVLLAGSLAVVMAIFGAFVPDKIVAMLIIAARYVPGVRYLIVWALPGAGIVALSFSTATYVGGLIIAMGLLFIFALIAGYALSIWGCGQVLVYLELRRRQFGQNILEREDDVDRADALAAATRSAPPGSGPAETPAEIDAGASQATEVAEGTREPSEKTGNAEG